MRLSRKALLAVDLPQCRGLSACLRPGRRGTEGEADGMAIRQHGDADARPIKRGTRVRRVGRMHPLGYVTALGAKWVEVKTWGRRQPIRIDPRFLRVAIRNG